MDKKNISSQKPKDMSVIIKRLREFLEILSTAFYVTTAISLIFPLFRLFDVRYGIPTVIISVTSSFGVVLYTIWSIYKKQKKQKKEVEDALRSYEQEFLYQVDLNFSLLLNEKVV